MKQSFWKMSQAMVGLAVVGLGVVVASDAWAQGFVSKSIEKTRTSSPFGCNVANNQFVIDEDADTCGGISTKYGPGWKRLGYPGLIKSAYNYITRVTENGREYLKWSPTITVPGRYEVWVSYRETPNRTKGANFFLFTDGGANYKFVINQNGWRNAVWAKLGTFKFDARAASATPAGGYVMSKNVGLGTSESVDAAYFRLIEPMVVVNPDADTIPVPGDYDGDGTADLAVYHTATGLWDVDYSGETATLIGHNFGWTGAVPVPGDFDGDGKADMALYNPTAGLWYIDYSTPDKASLVDFNFGWAGAVPVPGDFDGDGTADLALYHQSTGLWYIDYSTDKASLVGGHITP